MSSSVRLRGGERRRARLQRRRHDPSGVTTRRELASRRVEWTTRPFSRHLCSNIIRRPKLAAFSFHYYYYYYLNQNAITLSFFHLSLLYKTTFQILLCVVYIDFVLRYIFNTFIIITVRVLLLLLSFFFDFLSIGDYYYMIFNLCVFFLPIYFFY